MDEARLAEIEARARFAAAEAPVPTSSGQVTLTRDVPALVAEVRRLRAALRAIAVSSAASHQPVLDDVRRIAREALAFTGEDER
jgi:hypothetical protein